MRLAGRRRSRRLLDTLAPARRAGTAYAPSARIALRNFSFIDNPEETLASLSAIASADASGSEYHIDFHDDVCMDIGPFMVFGIMRQEMARRCKGGRMLPKIMKVLESVGMRRFLDMGVFPIVDTSDVWPFKLNTHVAIDRKAAGFETHESAKEKVCRRFADSLDQWLGVAGDVGLTDTGGDRVRSMLGEILDNARHANPSGDDAEWSVAGFMVRRQRPDGTEKYVCHVGIVTIGITFAESLRRAQDSSVRADVEAYSNQHRRSSIRWSADTLVTAAALTDGISCDGTRVGGDLSGCGMSSLVNMMNALGHTQTAGETAKLTLISGNGCISLSDPYNSMHFLPSTETYMQAFNEDQDLSLPPDPHYVYDVPTRFPGTVIAARFTIDKDNLRRLVGDTED